VISKGTGILAIDLRNDVFAPVLARVKERVESLGDIKRFRRTGIEGWFKVEVVAALGKKKVRALQNKGPDLVIEDGTPSGMKLELKAATNFDRAWFLGPIRKYGTPCLFLGDGTGRTGFKAAAKDHFEVVGAEVFLDKSGGKWIMGLVRPRRRTPARRVRRPAAQNRTPVPE
jgi:hypothetical protein